MPLWFLRKSADGVVILTFLAEGKQKSGAVLNDSTLWILQNATRVVANLSRMPLTSNAFMDMLVSLQQKLKSTGGVMKVCGLQPEVEALFREYEMDTVFEIFPDEKSALESFNSSENQSSSILPMVSELQPGLTNDDLAVSGSMAQYG
jgi:anti-anti-sigma regulatory factor